MSFVRSRVFARVSKELLEKGWTQTNPDDPELFHHPELGTHNIFKAAFVQRDAEVERGRRAMFKALLALCCLLAIGYAVGYILSALGVG
jgi:hypothetical protein